VKLNTLRQLVESEEALRKAEEAISDTLAMSVQAHFWHWQTKSYAAHEALGEFYETLTEVADEMAESFMGSGHEFTADVDITMRRFDMDDAVEGIREFKEMLVEAETELMQDDNALLHGVGDKVMDAVHAADKVLYLLTLK
jgi:DNA-binding ferritin-like protein